MSVMRKGWRSLSTEQRNSLLALYEQKVSIDEIVEICREQYNVQINATTLARRLREWRTITESKDKSRPGIRVKGNENEIEVSSVSERITSVDELLKFANVDLDIWEVSHFFVNSYESFRKAIDKDLTFVEGVVDGHVRDVGGVNIVPLFQVKAWLIRKEPVNVRAILQPVTLNVTIPPRQKSTSSKLRRILILPDPQVGFRRENLYSNIIHPFHDRRALDVSLQIAEDTQPDEIAVIGDFMDLSDWTDKFVREPEFMGLTQPAFVEGAWWLAQFALASPDSERLFFEGNHEKRMPIQTIKHMMAAWGIKPVKFGKSLTDIRVEDSDSISIPSYLRLDQLGYEFIGDYPDGRYWLNSQLRIEHGSVARNQEGGTVRAILQSRPESVITGHTHKIEMLSKTVYERDGERVVSATTLGCLCHIDGRVPGHNKNQNWQQGLGIVEYDPKGTAFTITPIYISNGVAVYNGKLYQSRDEKLLVDILRKDTEWDF